MKIAMIYPNNLWDARTGYQLGLAMLTTILQKAGHDAHYFNYYENTQELKQFDPDVLGYYTTEYQLDSIAKVVKEFPNKYHIAGGPYPTLCGIECIETGLFDAVFRGEADRGLVQFINSGLKDTSIPGFRFKDKCNPLDTQLSGEELTQLPTVIREPYTTELLKFDRIKRWESKYKGAIHFAAGRGCPYNCNFCANSIYNDMWAPKVRLRSVESLITEIIEVSQRYEYGTVVFADDIVTINKEWFGQFITEYSARVRDQFQKTLILNTRVDCIDTEQMQLLKEAKCVLLRAGIESGSTRIRKLMNRPMNSETIYEVFCKMIDAKLRTYSYNLIGYPSETADEWQETVALNKRIDAYANSKGQRHLGMVNVFYPYRGTSIGENCYQNNWVDVEKLKTAHPHSDYVLLKQPMTDEVIKQLCQEWVFNHGG